MTTLEPIKYKRVTLSDGKRIEDEMACGIRYPRYKPVGLRGMEMEEEHIIFKEVYNRLADIEDKIENGSAFIFPVRLGEELYFEEYNDKKKKYTVTTSEVTSFINISTDERLVEWVIGIYPPKICWGKEIPIATVRVNNIGKTVFASHKEAEAKAKEYNEKGAVRIIDGITVPIHFIEE